MTNLDSIFKRRDITLPTKDHIVKAIVFPVVMYGCESWTIEKTQDWITDTFELWCWRRLSRVACTARRPNQPILKKINSKYWLDYSNELNIGIVHWLTLKLKLQYFGHLMGRADSFEKTLVLGKTEGKRRKKWNDRGWGGWMASPTRGAWVWANSGR